MAQQPGVDEVDAPAPTAPGNGRPCGTLVLLVGSNPLPNYLAAATLRPMRALLVYSAATEPVMRRLEDALRALGIETASGPQGHRYLSDPWDATEVGAILQVLPPDAHLHYTGGTKVMAAQARLAFQRPGMGERECSYLVEGSRVLRYDDGWEVDVDAATLDLATLRLLHGITDVDEKRKDIVPRPGSADASALALRVLADPSLAKKMYDWSKLGTEEGKATPLGTVLPGVKLALDPIPDEAGGNRPLIKCWRRFVGGTWLELWVAEQVETACPGLHADVSVTGTRGSSSAEFEVDVVMVNRGRLYLLSVTTDSGRGLCKSKGFEVALRARHLGGDLARCGLVCFLLDGEDHKRGPRVVDLVRDDLGLAWDGPNPPAVFGLAELRRWLQGDRRALAAWLES